MDFLLLGRELPAFELRVETGRPPSIRYDYQSLIRLPKGRRGRFGYRCVSSDGLIEAAARYGVPEPKLTRLFDRTPSFWERLTRSSHLYLSVLQAAMCELAQGGKLVYHGQAGQQLLQGISHVMKVRLIAPLEYRIDAAMAREGLSREGVPDSAVLKDDVVQMARVVPGVREGIADLVIEPKFPCVSGGTLCGC